MTTDGMILFPRANAGPGREYSGRATVFPIEGETESTAAAALKGGNPRRPALQSARERLSGRRESASTGPRQNGDEDERTNELAIVAQDFGNVAWSRRGVPICAALRTPIGG